MSFFTTDNYQNGYQPEVTMPNIIPPKSVSVDDGIIAADKTNIYDENTKLRKKLKKVRKEKKRWKHKYLELSEELNEEKKKKHLELNEEAKKWKKKYLELRDGKKSIELARIEDGLGVPPIEYSLSDEDLKSRKFGIRYEYRG